MKTLNLQIIIQSALIICGTINYANTTDARMLDVCLWHALANMQLSAVGHSGCASDGYSCRSAAIPRSFRRHAQTVPPQCGCHAMAATYACLHYCLLPVVLFGSGYVIPLHFLELDALQRLCTSRARSVAHCVYRLGLEYYPVAFQVA